MFRRALLFLLVASALAKDEPAAFSFQRVDYFHRWSGGTQHEFTPAKQEDLEHWTEMVTINAYPDVEDGEELAATANAVLGNYQSHGGKILKTSSVPATEKRPAEHFIAVVFVQPGFAEAAFARFKIVEGSGHSFIFSHRIYGDKSGDEMNAWVKANGEKTEEALLDWNLPKPPKELTPIAERRRRAKLFAMSFARVLDNLALVKSPLLQRFEGLISPKSAEQFEALAQHAHAQTLRNFGRTMRLFAPLYLSNECINNCSYCGFSRDNPILRVTLSVAQVAAEGRHLAAEGFRHVLLVAGEHPKFVGQNYLADCVRALASDFSSIAIEVGPMETADYVQIVEAGAEGLVVYQETYDRETYSRMHTAGPKRDFNWRLDCAERGYAAGFRRLGIGALFGLCRWQEEALALAAHTEYLLKHCWRAQITVSLPRLRPAAGEFHPPFSMTDRELAQLICAFRITFPEVGIVLSTRERGALRDALAPLGVTMMSAGSHTEPGGYTHQGTEKLHRTVRGRIVAPEFENGENIVATGQFEISDGRSPAEVADALRRRGFEPVWKDWDAALLTT